MSVPIRRRRRLRCQMRFTARLHFVWSYYGEHLGLRSFLALVLLQVLLFLLPATAAAAAAAAAAAIAAAAGDLLCRNLWPLHQRS